MEEDDEVFHEVLLHQGLVQGGVFEVLGADGDQGGVDVGRRQGGVQPLQEVRCRRGHGQYWE